jgi:hypothetical protein
VARLDAQFSAWTTTLGDLSAPAMERAPEAGKWSAREHLAHITRMHGVCAARVRVILARVSPLLPPYRAEKDPTWRQWRAMTGPELLGTAAGRRATLIETVGALAARGVGFTSLQEHLDTATPGGKLVFHRFGALAEFERDLIRERTQAGLAAARARERSEPDSQPIPGQEAFRRASVPARVASFSAP